MGKRELRSVEKVRSDEKTRSGDWLYYCVGIVLAVVVCMGVP